ncbi:hypothetical protein F4819DRAFT_447298 [Hypoxylon fuscum]|nr:hypothetical protein F4819DRAFT_447298 [Hypoxylon fuscum]
MATANRQGDLGQLPDDDINNKNKSIVHSGRLIYAKPEDLPSFPSIGLSEKGSAASAAAALGWTTKTSPELWRPDRSAPASAAAIMAKDYKLGPMWEPVSNPHSAKAALLASQSAMNTRTGRPTTTNSGYSAANMAFRSDRSVPRTTPANTLERQKSLLAAKGAMASRQRALSTPVSIKESYPDEANAAANALSAATRAHRPVRSPTASEISENAGSVPYTNMNRQMFTSRPPVQSEVDDQKRADVLHASALAMAKKMYNQQQKMIDAKKAHNNATVSPEQADALSSISDDAQPMQLTSLQDAAYKQAQARLAKMHEEHFKNREYQDYYGTKSPTQRFSVRNKLRRRASSDGAVIEDRRRSQHINRQMTLFTSKLSEIDDRKRQQDQEALLAAAQKIVHERLKVMDEKISAETGMVPPSTLTQWELKAHATAQARSYQRISQRHGKIDIGAGKFMDQEDIDVIAAAKVKPVLDEINERVEEEHARQTELRLEMEKKKEEEEIEKARQKEIHDINKKLKEQDKQEQKEKRAEEKQEAKVRKEEDKVAKAEQKRLAKSEKRKSTGGRQDDSQEEPEAVTGTVALNYAGQPVSVPSPKLDTVNPETTEGELMSGQPGSPSEGSSRGGVKTWLKNRFSRGAKSADEEKPKDRPAGKGFIGGAALTGMESSASMDNRSASVRAVAMAGRQQDTGRPVLDDQPVRNEDTSAISPTSTSSDDEYFHDEVRDQPRTPLTPPRHTRGFSGTISQSPSRDSKFKEMV